MRNRFIEDSLLVGHNELISILVIFIWSHDARIRYIYQFIDWKGEFLFPSEASLSWFNSVINQINSNCISYVFTSYNLYLRFV